MLRTVFLRRNKKQIFWSVILRIAVHVMNMKMGRSFSHNTVLILPNIRLSNFYFYINKSVTRFVQCFSANGFCKFLTQRVQNTTSSFKNVLVQGFSGTCAAARRVVVCLAVSPWFAYDRPLAVRAKFLHRWAHGPIVCQA